MPDRKRILVVDDDPQLRRLMELTLRRAGYDVELAATGEEGVAKVISFKPDLVLMDVMMPDMDGFEATKRIRRLPEGRNIPVVFLSALTQVDAKIKGLRVGGTDYVTKPVNIQELLARIEAHLRSTAPPLGKLIVLFSSKGGVGTTTVAVNLPFALRKLDSSSKIILVDWHRPLGDVAAFLGLVEPRSVDLLLPTIQDVDEEAIQQVLVEYAEGIYVLPGATQLKSTPKMTTQALSNLLEVALTMADFVVLDAGPFFSWEEAPLVSKDVGANLCIITPEITSIRRAVLADEKAKSEEYDFWLLLNREGLPGGIATRQIESYLGHHLIGKLPEDPATTTRALNLGRPVALSDPRSKYMKALSAFAEELHKAGEL